MVALNPPLIVSEHLPIPPHEPLSDTPKKDVQPLFCSGYGSYHSNEQNVKNPAPYLHISLSDIYYLVDNPQDVDKNQSQWLIPSTLLSRSFKKQEENGEYWLLWADVDENLTRNNPVKTIETFLSQCDYEAYTTKSATEHNQKARIIIPILNPMCFEDWRICQEILNDLLEANNITPDRANERAAQLCYLPNQGAFYKKASIRSGIFFEPLTHWADRIQQKRQGIQVQADALKAAQKAAKTQRSALKTADAPDIIGAFNQAYTVQEILLKAGYDQRGDHSGIQILKAGVFLRA